MASVVSQLIEEVTAHAQSDSLEDAREVCADGTYFPNNLRYDIMSQNAAIWNIQICVTSWTSHWLVLDILARIFQPVPYALFMLR